MKTLPVSSAAFVWTQAGPKIVRTDACGEMVDLAGLRSARGSKSLPPSLLGLLTAPSAAPGPNPGPTV